MRADYPLKPSFSAFKSERLIRNDFQIIRPVEFSDNVLVEIEDAVRYCLEL